MTFIFILFMFLVAMFIVYFDYILSIVSLSLCLCISSYSIHPNVHRVGGRDLVSVVLICYLPVNTLYILGHVVDHGCDTPVESLLVISPNKDLFRRVFDVKTCKVRGSNGSVLAPMGRMNL
jgi:hypothetical protein